MCLSAVWTDEEMEAWLAEQPEVIEVWKYVEIINDTYVSPYIGIVNVGPRHKYRGGLNISINGPGFFFYGDSRAAMREAEHYEELNNHSKAIKCYIQKCDIKQIGKYCPVAIGYVPTPALVASQAIFPHYPETEARREDIEPFLAKDEVAECDLKKGVKNEVSV